MLELKRNSQTAALSSQAPSATLSSLNLHLPPPVSPPVPCLQGATLLRADLMPSRPPEWRRSRIDRGTTLGLASFACCCSAQSRACWWTTCSSLELTDALNEGGCELKEALGEVEGDR